MMDKPVVVIIRIQIRQMATMFREKDDVNAFLLVFWGPLFLAVGTLSVVRLISSGFNPIIFSFEETQMKKVFYGIVA